MAESRYIVHEVIARRQARCGERYIDADGNIVVWESITETDNRFDILRPVDPARVTVAPEPEAYTVTGHAGVELCGNCVFVAYSRTDALAACDELNRLHRDLAAAKGGA